MMNFLSKFLSPKKDIVTEAVENATKAVEENTVASNRLRKTLEDLLDRNDIVTGRRQQNELPKTRLQ